MSRSDRSKTAVPIGQALSQSRNPVVAEAMDRYRSLTPLETAWKQSVTQPLCGHAHPVALQDGVLTVHAESSVWANLLRNTEQSVVAALRDAGSLDVHCLRIRIAPPAPARHEPQADERAGDDPELKRRFAQLRRALE